MTSIKRKGARSIKEVPTAILEQLNSGKIETANLVESLAIDRHLLLENFLTQNKRTDYLKPVLAKIDQLKKQTVNTINEEIGTVLFELTSQNGDGSLFEIMANHQSDTVRGWATFFIGKNEKLNIAETLKQIQPFAADKHFGVRKLAGWLYDLKLPITCLKALRYLQLGQQTKMKTSEDLQRKQQDRAAFGVHILNN